VYGNEMRKFEIGDKKGVIKVIRKLEREELKRYKLVIKEEDNGGL
jgi:protocadherin-15